MFKSLVLNNGKAILIFLAASTVVLSFQNCSKFEGVGAANLSSTGSNVFSNSLSGVNPSLNNNTTSLVGSNGSTCVFSGDLNGWPSGQRGASSEKLGVVSLPYKMSDGSGSGVCNYDLATVGSVNAGANYNVTGVCTDPAGKQFNSKGSFWPVFGSGTPAVNFNLMAGIGQCGSTGSEISMKAIVNVDNGQVSGISIIETAITSNSSSTKVLATGEGGSYKGKNPYGQYAGWSSVQNIVLPEGSSCVLIGNPWGANQEVIVANCKSASGIAFRLSGMGPRGGVASGVGYEFEGTAQDGKTYDHFYRTGPSTWIGTWLNKGPVGYTLNYFNKAGQPIGTCSLGTPDSSGAIGGTCLLGNTQFNISGNIGSADSSGNYAVNFNGVVNNISFTAVVNYITASNSGSGTWSSSDGASGNVNGNANF